MTNTLIRAKAKFGAPWREEWKDADGWTVTLRRGARCLTVPFYKGVGHNGAKPTASEVLYCLCADASGIEQARSFEDWCSEYGYDTDSRSAEKTYRECERVAAKLKRFLGEDFERLLYADEDAIAEACAARAPGSVR